MKLRWCAIFLLFPAVSVLAADPPEWTVETGDFHQHAGVIQSFTADTLELLNADHASELLPVRDVLRCRLSQWSAAVAPPESANAVDIAVNQIIRINGVDMTVTSTNATMTTLNTPEGVPKQQYTSNVRLIIQANAARNRRGRLMLELDNGDRLAGTPVKIDVSSLIWSNELLGPLSVPLESLARLTRVGAKLEASPVAPAEDTVTLGNGDAVRGIMSDLSSGTLSIQSAGGGTNAMAIDSIQQVTFAQTSATRARPEHAFTVALVDGSQVSVSSLTSDGKQWSLVRLDGARQTLPATAVREFEQVGGPVVWLSDLTPSESSHHSLLGRDWPPQFDRAVDGRPLRFETRQFQHGIGVHAYSKLTFDPPSGFDRLKVNYAIDGDGIYADVTVRVLLDDKPVLEVPHVRAGSLASSPIIPLAGAKNVALEVLYGDNQDVQDRLNWIEPALLRAVDP